MAWTDDLPRWRCRRPGCGGWHRVKGAERNDLAAAKRAYDRHQADAHPDLDAEEVSDVRALAA